MKKYLPLFPLLAFPLFLHCGIEDGGPVVPPAEKIVFLVTGDCRGDDNGVNTEVLGEIVQAGLDEAVDFVLLTGDFVNGYDVPDTLYSQLLTFRETLQPLCDAGIAVYPCRGNHDAFYDSEPDRAWNRVFSGDWSLPQNGPAGERGLSYSFSRDSLFVVVVDQYVTDSRVNQGWLNGQFSSNALPHVFVLGHEPAFRVFHTDCLENYPEERNTFWQSMSDAGVAAYFTGHDHFYDHARLDDGDGNPDNDVHQFVVGTAGAPLYPVPMTYYGDNGLWTPERIFSESSHGYLLVEVEGSQATFRFKRRLSPGQFELAEQFSYTR